MSDLIHASLGPFVIMQRLGAGGFAEVYRAQHRDDAKSYAVKVLRRERCGSKDDLKRLEAEYGALRSLTHPGIPTARRFGSIADRPALVMDLVEGESAAALVARRQPIPAARYFVDLVAVVAYLHGEGYVHNDLKLENVMITPRGQVRLIDFGNVREMEATGFLSRLFGPKPTQVFGTPTYIAPELLAGKRPTPASDVYALGVCAFILLSGRPPFDGVTVTGRLRAHQKEAPPRIADRVAGIPGPAALAIDACLAKDPRQRPVDAMGLLNGVRALTPDTRPYVRRNTRSHRTPTRSLRTPPPGAELGSNPSA